MKTGYKLQAVFKTKQEASQAAAAMVLVASGTVSYTIGETVSDPYLDEYKVAFDEWYERRNALELAELKQ